MKVSAVLLAGLVSADERKVPPRHPLQRLNRLVEFTEEILDSVHFNNMSDKFKTIWKNKFETNAMRMKRNFERGNQRCGFYDDSM